MQVKYKLVYFILEYKNKCCILLNYIILVVMVARSKSSKKNYTNLKIFDITYKINTIVWKHNKNIDSF